MSGRTSKKIALIQLVLLSTTALATAQDRSGVYNLGEIVVVGGDGQGQGFGQIGSGNGVASSVITREQTYTFDKPTLDQAVNLVPGVSATLDANGRRNESDIFVRGFNRLQVPLSIDGVRVYLPADNRLDFSRFLTGDLSEIQIQKGYASVIDGPGGMGGAINLVTRKPTKPFEAELQSGMSFGGDGRYQGWNSYSMIGTRQQNYYLQASANTLNNDFWTMSGRYAPIPGSLENGGARDQSYSRDYRVNLKAGYTPNATDEYSINYTKQSGRKGAPLNVYNNPPVPANGFWHWPNWDVSNLSVLTNTQLGSASYVKTKLFYNTFYNVLSAFDDVNYSTQSTNNRFDSIYDDSAYGGSLELGTELIPRHSLKAALHYRKDGHIEFNQNRPTSPNPAFNYFEPRQHQEQTTWSVALEDTFHLTQDIDLVGGISQDRYTIDRAEEVRNLFSPSTAAGIQPFNYPTGGASAFNWQAAAIWRYRANARVHASVSDRARFPTLFELYSTRFGTATPNPNLGPERSTNYELGWNGTIGSTQLSAAVFYSDVRDMIQTVVLPDTTTQTQNVGKGRFYGVEGSIETQLFDELKAGANYTYIRRTITDPLQPLLQATGVPTHKALLYLAWKPVDRLTITPSLELASNRWSDRVTAPVQAFPYIETGAYALANVQVEYKLNKYLDVAGGVKNLFDQNYELAWGLPQPGRTFYAKAMAVF